MKKLHLTFLNAEGKKHKLIPKFAKDGLERETVKDAMERMSQVSIFEKKGIALFTAPFNAKYVETIETEVYQAEETKA